MAAFSARGATKEGIREAAEEDRGALLRGHNGLPGASTDEHGSLDAAERDRGYDDSRNFALRWF